MKRTNLILVAGILTISLTACKGAEIEDSASTERETNPINIEETDTTDAAETIVEEGTGSALEEESAADGHIDFAKVQESNPEVFAWIYIPETGIDEPILQSAQSDTFYQNHDKSGTESDTGALYTEMPNNMNMCDFNTIIHGYDKKDTDLFYGLHQFEDQDFFQSHELIYLYMPDNVLTYEVVAAYYDDGSDILRRYDYTTYAGCENYLEELFAGKSMAKHIREGWEDLTPNHFLLTLDGTVREDNTQYVVVAALIQDAAGVIDRVIYEE